MLKVSCPHCGTPTRIDSARLPDQPLTLPCPACQGQLVLDKAKLLAAQGDGVTAAPASTADAVAPAAPSPIPSPAPPLAAAPPAPTPVPAVVERPPAVRVDPPAMGTGAPGLLPPNYALPDGVRLPSGILIGDDVAVMAALSEALAVRGSTLEVLAGPEVVRQLEYVPELQVIVTNRLGPPPSALLGPFVDQPSQRRRRSFIVVVASDVETLDGNQAFLHEVDLLLAKGDLDRAVEILYYALDHRNRLYAPFLAAEEAMAAGGG
jgi:hypothetical protein